MRTGVIAVIARAMRTGVIDRDYGLKRTGLYVK
jgi:hypothetical protein